MKQKKAGVSAFTPAFRLVARHMFSSRCLNPPQTVPVRTGAASGPHRNRTEAAQEPHRNRTVWRAHHLFKAYGLTLRQSPGNAP